MRPMTAVSEGVRPLMVVVYCEALEMFSEIHTLCVDGFPFCEASRLLIEGDDALSWVRESVARLRTEARAWSNTSMLSVNLVRRVCSPRERSIRSPPEVVP